MPNLILQFEFLLFDGFSNLVLASAMEPLRDVQKRTIGAENLQWSISTIDGLDVTSSSGIKISPDHKFDPNRSQRHLIIITGYQVRKHVSSQLNTKLRIASQNAELILALDTAGWLLASAKLLNGKSATIHWQELDAFIEAFPRVHVVKNRYVKAGKFMTCGGASTALDLLLDLINEQFGALAAFNASNMFLHNNSTKAPDDRGPSRLRLHGSPRLLAALNMMVESIDNPPSMRTIAQRANISERSLHRLFLKELNMTPGQYFQHMKLNHARYLIEETSLNGQEIALRCGFATSSSLSRALSNVFGISIREIRNVSSPINM